MRSPNLYYVAACVSYGARIIDTVNNNGRVTFELADCPPEVQIQDALKEINKEQIISFEDLFLIFSSGKLWFPPNYPDTIQSIKALIFAR